MSHHHVTLPPIVYTPEPPKPKEARRRRRVAHADSAGAADEADEDGETAATYNAALPQQDNLVEAVERRNSSPSGKLSVATLTALLAAQEESGA